MAEYSPTEPEGKANIKRANKTLVPGDVVQMNIAAFSGSERNQIVLVLQNNGESRLCLVMLNGEGKQHNYVMHNDWQKIGHIANWQDMLRD